MWNMFSNVQHLVQHRVEKENCFAFFMVFIKAIEYGKLGCDTIAKKSLCFQIKMLN